MHSSVLTTLPFVCVISGGQTGVDRAALDWAIEHGVPHGGWCPRGRRALDGELDTRYRLRETLSADYQERTQLNVRDSDATLIINRGELDGGTRLTREIAQSMSRPCQVVQLDAGAIDDLVSELEQWLLQWHPKILNVAGPRENKRPGIYTECRQFLDRLWSRYQQSGS